MDFKFMHPSEQIVLLLNRVYQKGLTTTSGGNLSIKDSEGNIWITPSGIDKGSLTPSDICKVLPDGTVIGKHKASVELPFHQAVYACRPDVNAVLHAHSPALVSFSLVRKKPNVNIIATPHYVCGKIGEAKYAVPGSKELAKNIIDEIKQGYNAVMMENHGVICCADTLFRAFKRFETLNAAADLYITSSILGTPHVLTGEKIEKFRREDLWQLEEFTPKFHTTDELTLRKEMCALIRRSYDQGLFTSTQGTFAVKLSDKSFLITPRGVDRKYIDPEDIVRVDEEKFEEGKKPSRAIELVSMIFADHPEVKAVTIAQPKHIMAFGVTRTTLDSRTIPESYIAIRDIKTLPFGSNVANPKKVSESITKHSPVVMIENECVISTGKSLIDAFDKLEVSEVTAKTIIQAKFLGKIVKISDKQVKEINQAFKLD